MRAKSDLPAGIQEIACEQWAQAYLRSFPPEHFMKAAPQGIQREITLVSLALLKAHRPDVHVFNDLLVQYPLRRRRKPGQVVPDSMVVRTTEPIRALKKSTSSYNVALEPAAPFWIMEYVSKNSKRKDYEKSFKKYEQHLKVPYYLAFYPDAERLTLLRHNKRNYVSVKPNEHGRYAIPELDLEMALLDGWVRFWYKGELLPLPAELARDLEEARQQVAAEKRRADEQRQRADEQQRRADEQQVRAAEERQRANDLQQQLEAAQRQLAKLQAQQEQG